MSARIVPRQVDNCRICDPDGSSRLTVYDVECPRCAPYPLSIDLVGLGGCLDHARAVHVRDHHDKWHRERSRRRVRNALSALGVLVLIGLAALGILGALNAPVCTTFEDGSVVCDDGTVRCQEGGWCDD